MEAEKIRSNGSIEIYGIRNKYKQISTKYSSGPVFPDKLAEELRANPDLARKAPLDENGNIVQSTDKKEKIDGKERRELTVGGQTKISSRLCSERSEDLVTFTVFESLNILFANRGENTPLDIQPLLGGQPVRYVDKVRLWFGKGSDVLFWVPYDKKDRYPDNEEERNKLWKTIEELEKHPRKINMGRGPKVQYTEVDAVHINKSKKVLTFLDAKLTAKTSPCFSVKEKKCRYVKDIGCDYWKNKFGQTIDKYFKNVAPPDSKDGKRNGVETFCNKYYQLMRNWIFGNVLVDDEGAFRDWDFHLIHIGDINHLQDMIFYTGFKERLMERNKNEQSVRTFALTTWQNISSAVCETFCKGQEKDQKALSLLDWLSNHPVTGNIYGQQNSVWNVKL
ncbi:MAG: hypothetical protein V1701_07590 [Planctomycetota bacterium]